jgi:hypothetical protein
MRSLLFALALLAGPALADDVPIQAVEGKYKFQYVPVLTHITGNESALYFVSTDIFESYDDCLKGIKRSDRLFKEGMMKYRRLPLKSIKSFASCHLVGQGSHDMMFPVEE